MNFGSPAAVEPQLAPPQPLIPAKDANRSAWSEGTGGCGKLARSGDYRHTPCDRALLSAAEAVSQSGMPIAILVQPTPHGVPVLSHQIRHQPSSKRTSAKSARAGETVKPMARTPTAKISRFIADLLLGKM